MNRKTGVSMAAAILALAAGAWWFTRPRPINVLLITMDTTRADRLGCYGYAAARTPALDGLSREGLRFTRACTAVPLTLPSHATILTGQYPPEHGLRNNAAGKLDGEIPILSAVLRSRGYRTAAFVASFVLDRQFGLDRGFDVYDDRLNPGRRRDDSLSREVSADVVCDRALAWLSSNASRPFFCWVHFYDPHEPYEPPVPFDKLCPDPYDGEIAFMDAQIQRLLVFLERQGLGHRTLVMACGDHGESLGEHQEAGHGLLLYEPTMRVPLLLRLPGTVPPGQSDRLVSLVSVAPTILELSGQGTGVFRADNLLAGGRTEECYGESLYPLYAYRWAPLYSLTTRQWKYIAAPVPELYETVADPAELRNLAAGQPYVAGEMKRRLANWRGGMRQVTAQPTHLTPEAVARLRSLGYVAGSAGALPDEAQAGNLKDPKTMIGPVHNVRGAAKHLLDSGDAPKAVALLESIVPLSPESPELRESIVEGYLATGEPGKARPHIEAVLATDPENRSMLNNRGGILLQTGNNEEAIRTYRQVLALPRRADEAVTPSGTSKVGVTARVGLSVALMNQKKLDAAAEQCLLALKDDPDCWEAVNNLGNVYMYQGKAGPAIEQYTKSLLLKPDLFRTRENLGRLLCEGGQHGEGFRVWRKGLEFRPDEPVFLYYLAWGLATCLDGKCRNGAEAVKLAESLCEKTSWSNAQALDTLAAACAETGDFKKAVETAEKGLASAKAVAEGAELARQIEDHLRSYRDSKPWRQK